MAQSSDTISMFSLEGKTALVIGGGGVLGRAIARGLGNAGAKVAITGLFPEEVSSAMESLEGSGFEVRGYELDAFDKKAMGECVDAVEAELGTPNILVNAAGGNIPKATVTDDTDFFNLSDDALNKVFGLNLFAGTLYPCQVVGKRLIEKNEPASIINISSMSAFKPLTRVVGYSAAKAAVSNFTQWLSVYFARDLKSRVRVNALAPGFFLTEQNRTLLTQEDGSLTARGETILDHTPMGRFGEPEDLVGTVVWLASDASAFVTGTVVAIDGGFSAFAGV